MAQYEVVIGLEVHAQLKTKSKLFCACSTEFGNEPNENVCPVCSGMPGVLPVMNEKVLEYAVKMGLAVGCEINRKSVFARKNYFYPDLPKGYQTSQFDLPICEHGRVEIETAAGRKTIGVTRIHMEEDAGKSIHSASENVSFVDLNRSCVPLLEIVSEPDMRSAEEAVAYLKSLHSILRYLDICDGNMEQGSFRCDANVSIRPKGQEALGTRAELKNMNSFRHVQKAIEYEVQRQIDLVEDGEKVIQETRLYNADKGTTHSMRGKEEAHDYRYFPCPDLVPMVLDEAWIAQWGAELPELPEARCARFVREYDLSADAADQLTAEHETADFFEAALKGGKVEPKKVANWLMTDVARLLNDTGLTLAQCQGAPASLAALVALVEGGTISAKSAKDILPEVLRDGADPQALVKEKGLAQESDSGALEAILDEVIAENPGEAERFRAGEKKLTSFFMGQVMRKTQGKANPGVVSKMLAQKLS